MNGFCRLVLSFFFILSLTHCATKASSPRDDSAASDDFSDLEKGATPSDSTADTNSLDGDLDENPPATTAEEVTPPPTDKDEFSQFDEQTPVPTPAPEVAAEPPPPIEEPAPVPEAPPQVTTAPMNQTVTLKSIQYKANDQGGTIVVDADGPMTFTTRMATEQNQFIVEVPNSILPKRLTKPLVTKDFDGTVGSIDTYQNPGSNLTRIVVQLRPNMPEPVVQAEGNSILVVAQMPDPNTPIEPQQSKLLAYDSLEEFLAGNMTFYGKRISVETDDMEVRDVFKLISEEAGVNLIITDDVKGKMSLKLRNVPWDQALVMVMKSKKLSYSRTGSVLRIAPIADIRAEEDESIKIATNRKNIAPLKVRLVPISYAKVDELEKQVKPFLSARGTAMSDTRTSSLVLSDIDENLERIQKLIQSIDVPPAQVLIEGKIVEASDQFEKQIGINWQASGRPTQIGGFRSTAGALRGTSTIQVTPGLVSGSTFGMNFNVGTLDILGDLTATLALKESEGIVKVLSSPRIVTLHNEPADINQTTELPLITTTTSPNGTTSPTVTFKPVRLKLSVTPQITNDGAVIMAVDVNREFPGEIVNQETQARAINSRSAKTKVLVKNAQTAVIGGIYQSDSQEGESKVPWLGDVPVVGWLFKSKTKTSQKNELLIFLTPRILGQLDSQAIPSEGGSEL